MTTRTRGKIMDEGVLDSVKSDLFRVLRTYEYSDAMTIKEILLGSELLLDRVPTEREFVFSCDVIALCNGATFEFSSTGWYCFRVAPIKCCRNLGTLGPCNAR